jgi:phosphoglycerate dehydrogenase-like enzyme
MSAERLVAVSYPADRDYARVNAEVLAHDATIVSTFELDDEQRAAAITRADAVISWEVAREIPPGVLAAAPPPQLLQLLSAGVDAVDFAALPAGLLVAGNAGAYAGPMAEYVLAMTLSLAKGLPWRHAARERQDDVHDAHDEPVGTAAQVGGRDARRSAGDDSEHGGQRHHRQQRPPAIEHTGQDVAAKEVTAERERP